MKKIAIIGCSNQKLNGRHRAGDLYVSQRFKKAYQYAINVNADEIFILSAKYGLIHRDEQIESYDVAYQSLVKAEKERLHQIVRQQLLVLSQEYHFDPHADLFILLAGRDYATILAGCFSYLYTPIANLTMGYALQQLNFLNQAQHNLLSAQIHNLFNQVAKFRSFNWQNYSSLNFKNGIYVFFDKNHQLADGIFRIVRIGTHTQDHNLIARIRNHYRGSKNSSIFRKNIGISLLNSRNDDYVKIWQLDTSQPEIREKFADKINKPKEAELEQEVTNYINDNLFFVAFEVSSVDERLKIESGLISALTYATNNKQAGDWLGNFSGKLNILRSGMWLVKEMDLEPISVQYLAAIHEFYQQQQIPLAAFDWVAVSCAEMVQKKPHGAASNKVVATSVTNKKITHKDDSITISVSPQDNLSIKQQIVNYLLQLIDHAQKNGQGELQLTAGELQKMLQMTQRVPSVCSAMREVLTIYSQSELIYQPPQGNGTRFEIRYVFD